MKFKKIISATLASLMIFCTNIFAEENQKSKEYSYMDKMFGYASELYIDETLTKEEILDRALDKYLKDHPEAVTDILKAGFSQIDDYTEYYAKDEFEQYVNGINHTFYGIGVVIQKKGEYVVIERVLDDGPASVAGIQKDDKIYMVDGEKMAGKTIDEVQSAVTGELDTEVSVTVKRGDDELTFSMKRGPVNETTVNYIMLENNVAYVNILNFAMNTAEEFRVIKDELKEKNVDKIILDLRNNPGGYLVSAVDLAKMIVPEGIIVQTMYRQSEENITFYSDLKEPPFEFAVLVNENTASAAEILTGAIQDSGVGKVFGTTTYGKAVIQEMFNMRNDEAFKITTGKYLTRNGREINKKGLDPDIEVLNFTEPVDVKKYRTIDYKDESSIGDEKENVSVIKERLGLLGYMITSKDNKFDAELEAAVLDFQISKELEPTGKLDTVTMVQIENAFAKTEVWVDNQLYKAYEYFGGTKEGLDKILE